LLIYLASKLRRLTALQTKALITFVCVAAMIATPLLTTIKSNGSNSYNNNQLFLQQAFATHMDTATSNETTSLFMVLILQQQKMINELIRKVSEWNNAK
jgi:hypothetical protein